MTDTSDPARSDRSALRVITAQRVIAIVRSHSPEQALATGTALLASGVRAVEVSLVTPDALSVITRLRHVAGPDAVIGVGTAMTTSQVRQAAAAGAQFVVSPVCDADVIGATTGAGLTSIPGAATPTEAAHALRHGADLVKIFPASVWTPAALQDLLASMPDLPLVPTGGISLTDAPGWIEAGACAVGLGSALSRAAAEGAGEAVRSLLDRLAPTVPWPGRPDLTCSTRPST